MNVGCISGRGMLAASALDGGLICGSVDAAVLTIYSNDFDGNTSTAAGVTADIGSPALGTANGGPYDGANGKSWSGNFLHNATAGSPRGAAGTPTVFTFSNLPTHT